MKKKKTITLIAACMALFAGTQTSLGQNGVLLPENQQTVEPRRTNNVPGVDFIKNSSNVGNEYGAGESSVIGTSYTGSLQLGSDNSKNIVIRSYAGDGYSSGWISVLRVVREDHDGLGHSKGDVNYYPDSLTYVTTTYPAVVAGSYLYDAPSWVAYEDKNPMIFSFNKYNRDAFEHFSVNSHTTYWAECTSKLFESEISGNTVKVSHHDTSFDSYSTTVSEIGIEDVYTTTINDHKTYQVNYQSNVIKEYPVDIDNGVDLVQFNGSALGSSKELAAQTTAAGRPRTSQSTGVGGSTATKSDKLANYIRPTTISVNGKTTLEQITFRPIKWWYETYIAEDTIYDYSGEMWNCNSGRMGAINYGTKWSSSIDTGKTFVDAAFQLVNESEVCVQKNVLDNTGNIGSSQGTDGVNYAETNALVVYPGEGGSAVLRTHGDFQANMDNDYSKENNSFYFAENFPAANNSIFLMEGKNTFDFGVGGLTATYDGQVDNINIVKAPISTKSSIFGVNGKYDYVANMALVHTSKFNSPSDSSATIATSKKDDNRGVIEVGENTAAQIGADKFYIYSGGILKNFESCDGPNSNFTVNIGNGSLAPTFTLDGKEPLYIMNYGNNGSNACAADLNFGTKGIANLVSALGAASDIGALHIQARGDVMFNSAFSPTVSQQNNELRILSDEASIQFKDVFGYINNKDSNLVIWAQGEAGTRSCLNGDCGGYVHFAKAASIQQDTKGITLVRSENDDVYMSGSFTYTNSANGIDNGELIMQAGQDIYGKGIVNLNSAGQKSMLMEAKRTINLEKDFNIKKTIAAATKDSVTLKAGYDNFSSSAVVAAWTPAGTPSISVDYACTLRDLTGYTSTPPYTYYNTRNACQWTEGGDIWLQGPVNIDYTTVPIDSVTTILRAFNSIYFDDKLNFSRTASGDSVINEKSVGGQGQTMLFAETGNIEAIKGSSKDLTFTMGNDSSLLTLQAGNMIGNKCAAPTQFNCWITNGDEGAEYDGNILFNNKLNVTSTGTGNFLMSSARDIETQTSGDLNFTYTEPGLKSGDVLITAGRHVETHAPATFNYSGLNDTAKITIQAGRINDNTYVCDNKLCKVTEFGTQLTKLDDATFAYDPTNVTTNGGSTVDNEFAQGGMGHGSILAFKNMEFNYKGVDTILMTALNGNIESDPYLHEPKTYNTGNSLIQFNHAGKGITRMEAIDIKLHDALEYNGTHHTSDSNGWFYMAAFDSILTRNLTYVNQSDKGSVSITTDKIKMIGLARCEESIRQGHIVLGYGADLSSANTNDQILFDLDNNSNTVGANILIEAGVEGFNNRTDYKKKLYGGNITFDYMSIKSAVGNHTAGGYTKIHTPNGNIWGKDSLTYIGHKGDLLVDAGLGSIDDNEAIRWGNTDAGANVNGTKSPHTAVYPGGSENTLNTIIANECQGWKEWRTGNIMMKGGSLNYDDNGNATFRTRAGYIDTYDKFNVYGMTGQLLKYAHIDNAETDSLYQFGDVSERDFCYVPAGGSVYYGADDNIMFNYGNSNASQYYTNNACPASGIYEYDGANNLHNNNNPYYNTSYGKEKFKLNTDVASFNVNTNGYQWYNTSNRVWLNDYHKLFRGGKNSCIVSPITGVCQTPSNGARDINLDFNGFDGGFSAVANNYIDFFTKFTYKGGQKAGLATPTVGSIIGEDVTGYGLYIKSRNQGATPEYRRVTCFMCMSEEWPYVGFHDDARIHTENQKSLIEGPVIEFFGHAELDAQSNRGSKTDLVVKGDSLIFHDSAIFDGSLLRLESFTTDASARGDMRYGVVNDINGTKNYKEQGPAITMGDRVVPVLELGYQRCNEPSNGVTPSPNINSEAGKEDTPLVGGDIVVTCKNAFALPIFNTVVANHARISFIASVKDGDANGGEYVNACVRTDLLRIRNKVEFYTDPADDIVRMGTLKMTTAEALPSVDQAGIFPRHIHMEPGSELSLPGEDMLSLDRLTTVGGYGNIHENVFVKQDGIIAPGYASLMEIDCASGEYQGKLTIHNLTMEKDATMRISLGSNNKCYNENGEVYSCTQADTLHVQDTIFFNEKVPLRVLQEDDYVEPGCYLFLIYDDTLGLSKERVKNLVLEEKQNKNTGYYYSLDFTEIGKVYLCVSTSPVPPVQRYVDLHVIDGVKTNPSGKYYVTQKQNVSFTATYADGQERQVKATGYYSQNTIVLPGTKQVDGSYLYTIYNVVEPWDVYFDGYVANEGIEGTGVWTYKNILHINVEKEDIVSIYNMTGVLYRKIEVPAGNSKFTLDKGMYIVTLKDGSVHKIVIK